MPPPRSVVLRRLSYEGVSFEYRWNIKRNEMECFSVSNNKRTIFGSNIIGIYSR